MRFTLPFVGCAALISAASTSVWAQSDRPDVARRRASSASSPIHISRETTLITGPVDEDGYVDYLEAVNRKLSAGVTPENNAAVLLRRAVGPGEVQPELRKQHFKRLGIDPLPARGNYLVGWWQLERKAGLAPEAFDRLSSGPWRSEDHPAAAQWLTQNDAPLRLVIQATKRPRYYTPLLAGDASPKLISALLPAVQESRSVARVLKLRAMNRLGDGDLPGAADDLLAMHRLARLIGQGGTLVGGLVAIAIDSMALQGDLVLAAQPNLTSEQALAFLRDRSALPPIKGMRERMDFTERLMFLDTVNSLARGDGIQTLAAVNGQPQAGSGAVGGLSQVMKLFSKGIDWNVTLRTGNRWYDKLVSATDHETYAEQMAAMQRLEAELQELASKHNTPLKAALIALGGDAQGAMIGNMIGEILCALLLPATKASIQAEHRSLMQQDLARVALALAAYRAEQGNYPESLDTIGPKYLGEMPADRFSGKPLRYALRDEGQGYLLYSLGPNQRDDAATSHISQTLRGEWIPRDSAVKLEGDDLVVRMPVK